MERIRKTSRWTENFLRFRKTLSLMISKTVRNLSSISAALTADFVMPATGMKPITGIISMPTITIWKW
jgi:hypothetical protein